MHAMMQSTCLRSPAGRYTFPSQAIDHSSLLWLSVRTTINFAQKGESQLHAVLGRGGHDVEWLTLQDAQVSIPHRDDTLSDIVDRRLFPVTAVDYQGGSFYER
jgi:hypothetical protein